MTKLASSQSFYKHLGHISAVISVESVVTSMVVNRYQMVSNAENKFRNLQNKECIYCALVVFLKHIDRYPKPRNMEPLRLVLMETFIA